MFTRAYEQRNLPRAVPPAPSRSAGHTFSRPVAYVPGSTVSSASAPSTTSMATKPTPTPKLSPAEIVECRAKGQCFHCNELFTNGHKQLCKQLFIIEVFDEEEQPYDDPTISLHALTGIQSSTTRTMQLQVKINGATLTALLDSGSTHNFLDADVDKRVGVTFHCRSGL
jgi:hypothetical protein